VDSGLDEGVDVEGGAAIGAAVVVFDLFHLILLGMHPPPKRLVGHRSPRGGHAVYYEDGVRHRIRRDQLYVRLLTAHPFIIAIYSRSHEHWLIDIILSG